MRRKYVWHNGQFVDITDMPRRPQIGPNIIRDNQDPMLHPIDGQYYDSKSQFRAITAQHGCIEVGNELPVSRPAYEAGDIAEDIAQAFQMVEQGYQVEPVTECIGDENWNNTRIL